MSRLASALALATLGSLSLPAQQTGVLRAFDLVILDGASEKPIPYADFEHITRAGKEDRQADEHGVATIGYEFEGVRGDYLTLNIELDGYAPVRAAWMSRKGKIDAPLSVLKLPLPRSKKISGQVVDAAGKPVEDAELLFRLIRKVPVDVPGDITVQIWNQKAQTDSSGKWSFDLLPEDLVGLQITARHPGHPRFSHKIKEADDPLINSLRDGTAVLQLSQGLTLTGRIQRSDGSGVLDALVLVRTKKTGDVEIDSKSKPIAVSMETDWEGNFQFPGIPPGDYTITVRGSGFAPDTRDMELKEDGEPLVFQVEDGDVLSGIIRDDQGRPIAGAMIAAEQWRGLRVLDFAATTDSAGRFHWQHAPDDVVMYRVSAYGYEPIKSLPLKPGEHELTLKRLVMARGRVTEKESGQRIPAFRVLVAGLDSADATPDWETAQSEEFINGFYKLRIAEPAAFYRLAIESKGYQRIVSLAVDGANAELLFDVQLEKVEQTE